MASRKKADPAVLRTLSFLTGKTPLEEAEDLAREEEDAPGAMRSGSPTEMVDKAEETAIRWLGMDVFHEGDDIKIAVHPSGHAVVVLVSTSKPAGAPYGTSTFKLSRAQWTKLKQIVREAK